MIPKRKLKPVKTVTPQKGFVFAKSVASVFTLGRVGSMSSYRNMEITPAVRFYVDLTAAALISQKATQEDERPLALRPASDSEPLVCLT